MQDFHVVSSYVTPFKEKISNLEFGDFDLAGFYGVRVNGVKLGYGFQHTKSSLIELIFCTHTYRLVYTSILTPSLRFLPDKSYLFCIQSARTMVI
jgi:hypothetical protein